MLSKFVFLRWIFILHLIVNNYLWASEDYIIKNVQVDVTGSSALEARTQAITDAQRQAYNILLEKLLPQHDSSLQNLTNEQLDALVQSIEVQSEKNSDVRYLGTLTIHFSPQAIQEWFTQQGQKVISSSLNETTVIVPVLVRHEKTLLWDENNLWWQAWNQTTELDNKALIIPMGDLIDLKTLSVKDALEGNPEAIRKTLSRYHANRMIVCVFYENLPSRLEIFHYSPEGLIDRSSPIELDTNKYAPVKLLSLAIAKVIEAQKITLQTSLNSAPRTLHFTIRFNNYLEWIKLQKYLKTLQGVKKINIHTVSLKEAHVSFDCPSSEEFIESELKSKGIMINHETDESTSKIISLKSYESPTL